MYLIVGHPRCGTGYMAGLFCQMGLDVGHEKVGRDGTSNWVYAVPDQKCFYWVVGCRCNYVWSCVIHCVRDPWTAIPSIARTEIFNGELTDSTKSWIHVKASTDFRRRFVHFPPSAPLVEQAVLSFLGWNRMIEDSNPDYVVRIEHALDDLKKCPDLEPRLRHVKSTVARNQRNHDRVAVEEWQYVSEGLMYQLDRWCERYGYETVSSRLSLLIKEVT